MPAIIYQANPNQLIPQPGRTVATFPSGLCRVDQTFMALTADEATHRTALAVGNDFPGDTSPGVDGLSIFPDPQEVRRGDGFTEFRVSGYGRTTEAGRNLRLFPQVITGAFSKFESGWINRENLSEDLEGPQPSLEIDLQFQISSFRGDIVGQLVDANGEVNLPIPLDLLNGQFLTVSTGWTVESVTNTFTSPNLPGEFRAIIRWRENNSDGTPIRIELDAEISAVQFVVESDRIYGAIGEFSVFGSRVSNLIITDFI